MRIADKRGQWFTNFSQYRMHDPMSDTLFESGETVKATPTAWLTDQKAIIKPTDEEGNLVDGAAVAVEAEPEQPEGDGTGAEAEKPKGHAHAKK